MRADCHIHMVLDGVDWKQAALRHRPAPEDAYIRRVLGIYRELGYTYLRDGGDKWGVSARTRQLAEEFGICYRTPIAPISMVGHYGGFIGCQVADLKEYAALVRQFRRDGADFIKIMISGLMDFDRFGVLTEAGLAPETIRQMICIAHDEGFAVMAHANGARTVQAAAEAGVDSVEHGAYLDEAALAAMAENQVVWVPTLSTIGNLTGVRTVGDAGPYKGCHSERSEESPATKGVAAPVPTVGDDRKVGAAGQILESALENVGAFAAMGGLVAPGTDAGAFNVPHGCGTEEGYLRAAGVIEEQMEMGAQAIRGKF